MPSGYTDGPVKRKPSSKLSTSLSNKLRSAAKKTSSSSSASKLRSQSSGLSYNQLLGSGGRSSTLKSAASAVKSTKSSGGSSGGGNSTYRAPSYSSRSSGSSSGGSGGVGAPTTSAPPPPAWNPTGLAANYLESAADLFAKDPTLLLRDLATQRYGRDGGETIYSQVSPVFENANALYLAMMGQDANQGNKAEFINWLGSLADQQFTPGEFFNYRDAVRNIFGAAEGSPLRGFLTTGDAVEQGDNFDRVMNAILETSYHPLMAQGIRNELDRQQQEYAIASAKAAVDPFITYLQARNPNLTRLIGA